MNYKSTSFLGFVVLFVFLIFLSVYELDLAKKNHYENFIRIAPPENISNMVLGQRAPVADLFWIRLIQDFSFCDKRISKLQCVSKGWAYHLLNAISHLDPKLRIAHMAGPLMLTIVVGDSEGASKIFDRSVELFPKDWPILYGAAYQALFEEKNNEKAAGLFEAAGRNGGPTWFMDAAHKLYLKSGRADVAEKLLEELQHSNLVPQEVVEKLEMRAKDLDKAKKYIQ